MNLPPFLTFSTKKGGTKSALKHFLSFEKDYTHYHYYYTKSAITPGYPSLSSGIF